MNETSPPPGMSGLSIASAACGGFALLTSLAGMCCGPLFCAGGPLAIAALVTGFLARSAVKEGRADAASGMPAMAGMVMGGLSLAAQGLLIVVSLLMGGLSAMMGMLENM